MRLTSTKHIDQLVITRQVEGPNAIIDNDSVRAFLFARDLDPPPAYEPPYEQVTEWLEIQRRRADLLQQQIISYSTELDTQRRRGDTLNNQRVALRAALMSMQIAYCTAVCDREGSHTAECLAAQRLRHNTEKVAGQEPGDATPDKDSPAALDLCEAAWGIIANAGEGDWRREHSQWVEAANAWRLRYNELVGGRVPGYEIVP